MKKIDSKKIIVNGKTFILGTYMSQDKNKLRVPKIDPVQKQIKSNLEWDYYPRLGLYHYQDPCISIQVAETYNATRFISKIQHNIVPYTTQILREQMGSIFEVLEYTVFIYSISSSGYAFQVKNAINKYPSIKRVHKCTQ